MKTKIISSVVILLMIGLQSKSQVSKKICYSIAVNNIFTYPQVVNLYGSDVGKINPKVAYARQVDWRFILKLDEHYAGIFGM